MNSKSEITITNIFWKRTYLFIEYKAQADMKIALVKCKVGKNNKIILESKQHIMETKKIADNYYRAKINIVIAEKRKILEEGEWLISCDEHFKNWPKISSSILQNIENYSRVYRYSQNLNAYVVTFHILNQEPIILSLYANYMTLNKHPEKLTISEVFRDNKTLVYKAKRFCLYTSKKILNLYYKFCSLIPKSKKRILFMSQNMDHIRDNMEAVRTRLYERKLNEQYKISYSFVNIFDKKIGIFYWLKLVFQIAINHYIFVDDYVPVFSFLNMNKNTVITQLWHAGFGFKLVGYGRFGISGSPRPNESCHRKYTYGIVGNSNLKEIYSEVWGIEKESILATGMPRLEHFLDKERIKKTKEKFEKEYPQLIGKRLITFAPTYRGLDQKTAYYDYSQIDFTKLYELCKETNSVIAFCQHCFIKQKIPIDIKYKDLIYDMSSYKLNDILYSTDVLVTDYSSCFYDFLLLNKPILFYTYDKDVYTATRGIHRPLESVAPGKICMKFDEVIKTLKNNEYGEKRQVNFLVDKCLTNKKIASDQIIDYIILGERGTEKV